MRLLTNQFKTQKMNKKVLKRMYDENRITKKEFESGVVDKQKYQMYIQGVEIIDSVFQDVESQIKSREKKHKESSDKNQKTKHQRNLTKLYKLRESLKTNEIKKPKTQLEAVQRYLSEFGSITSWIAFKEFGITRLSSIIYRLRNEKDLNIDSVYKSTKSRYGNIVNYSKYTLNNNK